MWKRNSPKTATWPSPSSWRQSSSASASSSRTSSRRRLITMVEIKAVYEGQLHCTATHGPSGMTLTTDAPKDNMGKGESFSPTDLVATALATCVVTTMGIVAQRHNLDITGTTVRVEKHMITT